MTRIDDNKILGSLCARGHNYRGTGKSLRYQNVKSGSLGYCSECQRISMRKYINNNSNYGARRRETWKAYEEANADKIRARKADYYKKNKKRIRLVQNDYDKRQAELNTQHAIKKRLRNLVYIALRKYAEDGKIMLSKKYGIDYAAIIAYLGPHPNTRGISGDFHIDHIIPLSAFDLNDPEQIKLAFAPGNHQWLRAKENKVKKNRIVGQLDLVVQEQLKAVLLRKAV